MSWSLDGVDLSTLAWNVKNRSAGWTIPGKSGDNIRVPGRHGAFWSPNKTFDEGHLSLSMWAVGCNPDGSFPITGDAKLKVRDNLDKLSALFTSSNRLLNLRHISGDGGAIINELTNSTFSSSVHSGQNVVTNSVLDSNRQTGETREIARNLSPNPFLRGRTTQVKVATEDLYPDPIFNHRADFPADNLLTSYYYPINQDAASTNLFFAPHNGFSLRTGISGGRGIYYQARNTTFPAGVYVGRFEREVYNRREDGTIFFLNIKLSTSSISNAVRMRIIPRVSSDGDTWITGTASEVKTLTKENYSWFQIPASSLPTLEAGPNRYYVSYILHLVDGTSWNAGSVLDSNYAAIQQAPKAGNPWRSVPPPTSILMADKETALAVNRGGNTQMGWTDFTRTPSAEWEAVVTSSTNTTAPYAWAWNSRDRSRNNEGNLNFTVYGGTMNTFRRVLPTPQYSFNDVKIWGQFWRKTSGNLVMRITERTGAPGSYTYTTVASTTLPSNAAFTSSKFAVTAGKTYCLEIDVPAGTQGLNPSVTFRELHVSNGLVNTALPNKAASYTGIGFSCKFTGSIYASSIVGYSYRSYGASVGLPAATSKAVTATNVNWLNEPQRIYPEDGVMAFDTVSFPNQYPIESLTVRLRAYLCLPDHMAKLPFLPTSDTANVVVSLYDAAGAVTRDIPFQLTNVTTSLKSYSFEVIPTASEVAASLKVSYSNPSFPMSMVMLNQYHMMVNRPKDFAHFTGAASETEATWARSISWMGQPYFSPSTMKVSLPKGWFIEKFNGFDADNYSIRTEGNKITVPVSLEAGHAYVGLRRGQFFSNMAVAVKPQGASTETTLGTINSSVESVAGMVTIPANCTFLEFSLSGTGLKSIRDIHAFQGWQSVYPIPSSSWRGFSTTQIPSFNLPSHPSGMYPSFSVVKYSSGKLGVATGTVPGWEGFVLEGGFLQVGTYQVASSPVRATGGFISGAVNLQVESDASGKVTLELQKSVDGNTWSSAGSVVANSVGYKEYEVVDSPLPEDNAYIRLVLKVSNSSSPLSRSGIVAVADGTSLVHSKLPLGDNFPGVFVGVRGADGVSQYMGHIRQTFVEVTEAVDMESQAYGTIAEFNVNMNVPGAFWEDVYDTSESIESSPGKVSGAMFFKDFLGATAPMQDVVIEVSPISGGGSLTSFTLRDRASGNYITYTGPAQNSVRINTTTATITNSSSASIIKYITGMGSSTIMSLTPYKTLAGDDVPIHLDGVPILEWTANVPIKVTVTGRRKYLLA